MVSVTFLVTSEAYSAPDGALLCSVGDAAAAIYVDIFT